MSVLVLLGLLVVQAAPAAAAQARPAVVVERPTWVRKPTGNAVLRVYPELASRYALSGRAVVECRVRLTGMLDGCRIIEETPAGVGFGDAVLKLTPSFQMAPEKHDGVAVDGAVIKIPISFSAAEPSPLRGPYTTAQAVACAQWHKARLGFLPGDAESTRGVDYFSARARELAAAEGVGAKDVGAALAGDAVAGLPSAPSPSAICRIQPAED